MKTKLITIAVVLTAALVGCHKKEGEHHHHDEHAATARWLNRLRSLRPTTIFACA